MNEVNIIANTKSVTNIYKLCTARYSTHQIIKQLVGFGKTVLDIGCNEGYLGKFIDQDNIFYGLDNSKEAIAKAKTKYQRAIYYDLNSPKKLPFNIKFDVIIFADVLEHLIDPEKTLKFFINNYLKKDGEIIISVPNIANWQIRLNLIFGRFEYQDCGILDKTHFHFYTFKSARELPISLGLKVVKEIGTSLFFGGVIKTFPSLKKILSTEIILVCTK